MTDMIMAPPTFILTRLIDVIDELGGVSRVARLAKVTRISVWAWKRTGRIPPRHYPAIRDALALCGCRPDLRLFAFTTVDDVAA